MSDNWVVQNLENALEVWNDKLSEIWQLITQSPETFKGGDIWSIVCSIHGALQAIGYALLIVHDSAIQRMIGGNQRQDLVIAAGAHMVKVRIALAHNRFPNQ